MRTIFDTALLSKESLQPRHALRDVLTLVVYQSSSVPKSLIEKITLKQALDRHQVRTAGCKMHELAEYSGRAAWSMHHAKFQSARVQGFFNKKSRRARKVRHL
ncbi:hypothetical protein ELE36_06730 [Pseudolysobacter antarcticus]|uniref:Uncharacterized protein n=1 Tax=Pseudolysobacter antarcticus TaxID=2511995 RepID=A0A411HHR8_9GAMM|nr:hypothetical protein [Pseudolysobacter antarcticus]QBB70082.1 hypothetical protein ELE36_06730 [Pseudolysobacter antarcticus]